MNLPQIAIALAKLGFKKGGGGSGLALGTATPHALGGAAAGTALAAAHEDHVHAMVNALQTGAIGIPSSLWNASTNTPTLASNTPPSGSSPIAYTVSVAGTTTIDGISAWGVGDVIYTDGTHWQRISASVAIAVTTALLKGDGVGGISPAAPYSDYLPAGFPILVECGVSIILPPSGSTIAANGAAITIATAFLEIYSDGAWMKFNANEIASGQMAGFYWVVMSSVTAGVVYQNTYTPGSTSFNPPASPTAWTTNAGGTTTGTIANTTALQVTLPGGRLGNNGRIRFAAFARNNNSAGSKKVLGLLGAFSGFNPLSNTTITGGGQPTLIMNKGTPAKQVTYIESNPAGSSSGPGSLTVNTAVDQIVSLVLQTSVATDWVAMNMGIIEAYPA